MGKAVSLSEKIKSSFKFEEKDDTSSSKKMSTLRDVIAKNNTNIEALADKNSKLRDKKQKLTDIDKRKPIQDEINKNLNAIVALQKDNDSKRAEIKKIKSRG
jgi:hypothetical protein